VDEVLDTKDVVFSECLLDHLVIREGYPLFVDLSVAALVDQLADSLEVRLSGKCSTSGQASGLAREDQPISDVWLDEAEHLLSSLGNLHKDTIVDLQQTEEL
jgi:hypothetical protein